MSRTGIYAIRAVAHIASQQDKKPLLSCVIAKEMQIPVNFLLKILNRMVQAGLIRSIRGRNGGFALAKTPSEIPIRDIVVLFMQLDSYKKCFLGLKNCLKNCDEPRGFHERWNIITEQFEKMLNDTTIDQI